MGNGVRSQIYLDVLDGSVEGFLSSLRGIRQGYPFSPLLFILNRYRRINLSISKIKWFGII